MKFEAYNFYFLQLYAHYRYKHKRTHPLANSSVDSEPQGVGRMPELPHNTEYL